MSNQLNVLSFFYLGYLLYKWCILWCIHCLSLPLIKERSLVTRRGPLFSNFDNHILFYIRTCSVVAGWTDTYVVYVALFINYQPQGSSSTFSFMPVFTILSSKKRKKYKRERTAEYSRHAARRLRAELWFFWEVKYKASEARGDLMQLRIFQRSKRSFS